MAARGDAEEQFLGLQSDLHHSNRRSPMNTNATTATSVPDRNGVWARILARIYDPFLWLGERAGMRSRRAELLAQASGRVLEIGAGTGLNVAHYNGRVEQLILTEPEEPMAKRLEARLDRSGWNLDVLRAEAERLPLPDDSVDTVVSTMVLCTVDDPARATDEIARVLRPGGQLLFIEHIRSEGRFNGWAQDLFKEPWRRFARGCHCNRRTLELLLERDFQLTDLQRGSWKRMPPLVRPLVTGRALTPTPAPQHANS
jgi:ubiquinone/menaquinone biosynthesis C-methylase UbiE